MNHQNRVKELIKRIKKAAYLEGDFTTRSGKKTSYYIDKYLFETKPEILKPLSEELAKLFPESSTYDRIAAPELGAVPIASLVSIVLNKPFIIIKKENKGYGTSKLIEGTYNENETVVMIEDVMTTGGAVLRACEIVENNGLRVKQIVGIINRQEGAEENIKKAGYKVISLISTEDLRKE